MSTPGRVARFVTALALWVFGLGHLQAQTPSDALKQGFENPPNGARPRVWWHWMNGNITKEGIKLDLEWMHRVGLGGFGGSCRWHMRPGCGSGLEYGSEF